VVTWDEKKRLANIKAHGLDFSAAKPYGTNSRYTRGYTPAYREQRWLPSGGSIAKWLFLVYTERRRGPHIISLRKAEKYEARYYLRSQRL